MAGKKLSMNFDNGHSDAHNQSDKLYEYLDSVRHIEKVDLFDCCANSNNEYFTGQSLSEELSRGYMLADIITHGMQTFWSCENSIYCVQDASIQNNMGHTIILTSSCNTNAFDCPYKEGVGSYGEDPCLSESLIRNPKSGVVAFWGSSRENWTNGWDNGLMDPSLVFEKPFYELFFCTDIKERNFAKLIAYAKLANLSLIDDETFLWLQYSMNPIGDPEINLYSCRPQEIPIPIMKFNSESVVIDTGVEADKICLMSEGDDGESFYRVYENTSIIEIRDLPEMLSICVTKSGYRTRLYRLVNVQNKIIEGDCVISGNMVRFGSSVNPTKTKGPIVIKSGNVLINGDEIILEPGFSIEKDANVIFKQQNK